MQELYLANNIKRFRKERGFSQEDLARSAGITYSALSKIEALEVTIDDLMSDEKSG
jgi:transcriptional regulator with XRE-family HTH domain